MRYRIQAKEEYRDPNGVRLWRPVTLEIATQGDGYAIYSHGHELVSSAPPQPRPDDEPLTPDENGECPNCANPPHAGPCRRKATPAVPTTSISLGPETERRKESAEE